MQLFCFEGWSRTPSFSTFILLSKRECKIWTRGKWCVTLFHINSSHSSARKRLYMSFLRITQPYASSFERNTFNVDRMQLQQWLRLQKSTLNAFFIFSASEGGQKGPVFYIYYERITGHRSK